MKKITIILLAGLLLFPAVSFAAFNQNLSYGSSGTAVTDLQTFLTDRGFYSGPITGGFFNLTKSAVIAFQKQNGIQPASGFFGSLTRAAANKLVSVTASSSATSAVVSSLNQTSPVQPPTVTQQQQSAQAPDSPQDIALKIAQCQASTTVAANIFITAADEMAETQINPVIQQNQAYLESLITLSVNGGNPQPFNPQFSAASQVAAQQATQAGFQPAIDAEKARIVALQNGLQQLEDSAKTQAETISSNFYLQCLS